MHRLLERQLKKFFDRPNDLSDELRQFAHAVSDAYTQADDDRAMIERSMELSSRELLGRNNELALAERKYRDIFEHVTEGIFQATPAGQYLSANPALAAILGYESPRQLTDAVTDIANQVYLDPNRRSEILSEINRHGSIRNWESQIRQKNATVAWISETARAVRDAAGNVLYYEGTAWDITLRKQAELERQELQNRLISLSRQAGMSEVATGVLHNVGNALNSINVSAALVTDRIRNSKLASIAKMADLLLAQNDNLATFLVHDEKGRQIPDFLGRLAKYLLEEQQTNLTELSSLEQNIDHVKRIVAMQQDHAKGVGLIEPVRLADLLEDALRMNIESLERHRVAIVRDIHPVPLTLIDKHQVLQILVNLVSNAKQAMRQTDTHRTITVRVALSPADSSRAVISVTDAGIGISKQNLTRIFAHGFTTKSDGHGFGLHTSALAAQKMGGSLAAHSDGPGSGATFTLELPIKSAAPKPAATEPPAPQPQVTRRVA